MSKDHYIPDKWVITKRLIVDGKWAGPFPGERTKTQYSDIGEACRDVHRVNTEAKGRKTELGMEKDHYHVVHISRFDKFAHLR